MATRKPSVQETGDQPGQDALVGYQMAITLWTHEGAQNWSRFNMLLVVNSIIMIVLGSSVSSGQSQMIASIVFSIVGLVLSAAWFLISKRSFDTQRYYVRSAREIEETYLAQRIKTVSRGGDFEDGKPVTLTIDGKPAPVKLGTLASLLTAENTALVVIGVFFALNILFALLVALQLLREIFYF